MTFTTLNEHARTPELLIFGDLTANFLGELRLLLHSTQNATLQSFFDRVAFRLREELGRHPSAIQSMFPRFTTLIDIVAKLENAEGAPVLKFFLMTVCQLAKFIHFATDRQFPSPDSTHLLGICTGSFAASAICVSRSVSDVAHTGVEAARVAFRTALRSFLQRGVLSDSPGDKSWSGVVLRQTKAESLVTGFVQNNPHRSLLSRPYISATSPMHVTVSGPPEILDEFLLRNSLESHRLSIETPFHAPHLFDESDIQYALEQFSEGAFFANIPRIPILSGSTGKLVTAATFRELLRAASTSVLLEVVQWDAILNNCSITFGKQRFGKCDLYPFHCNAASMVSSYISRETSLEVAVQNIAPPPQSSDLTGRLDKSKIAIVGYSGRFPEASSNEELWQLLHDGRDVHRTIPRDRFHWETYYDPSGKKRNTSKVKHGCFINEPGLFDTRFFNMSPREADNTDPAQRLAITATYEAMEMAGMVPNRTPSTQQDRIGVFFGVTSDDWREVNSSQNVDTYFIPGGVRAFLPGRISFFFRFSGPSLCIDTACSSSLAAIQSACGYLWRGECDTAIAGGTNVLTNPDIFTGLDRGHFLAKSGNCNTFDNEASGYCRGEAVGAVILKRLEDALADKDPIFGVISGSNTNHCGQTDSITRPHEGDQISVFNRVLRYQNVDPNNISYVEMHGTGTQAGDATEMRSVLSVFLPDKRRKPDQPLYLGSAKANIGHGESASGVSALIKVLLMMKNNEIPPHCGIKTKINKNYPIDLTERNVRIALKPTPWRREDSAGGIRRAFLNNFSAAGGNTAILLEDAPLPAYCGDSSQLPEDQRGTYVVSVTAKTAKSLQENLQNFVSFLDKNPCISLPTLSYTTTARRLHHNYRVAFTGENIPSIINDIKRRAASGSYSPIPTPVNVPKVAFVFTGQGSLYTNLGRDVFETVSEFRDDIIRFNFLAQQHGFPPFLPLIDGSISNLDGVSTCMSHLALVCLQVALARLWCSWGIRPSMVVGHSLGEYAALVLAGVITISDAIFLVGSRAKLLEASCTPGTHAMLAIKAAVDIVQPLLKESSCELACVNQPMGSVIGGAKDKIDELAAKIRSLGYDSVLLDIPYSFHTEQVEPILDSFERVARSIHYRPPQIPVLSPLLGCVVQNSTQLNAEYLAKACRGVVNFQGALQAARVSSTINEHTIWLEIGSHPACSGMIKGVLGSQSITLATLRKATSPWKCIALALASMYTSGLNIDWNNHYRDFIASHDVVQLPRYSWDVKNHWIMYKNDFLLTKGEGTITAAACASQTTAARYVSPSVQRVLEETHDNGTSAILTESDIFDGRLVHILRGHMVNGAALCPSTLYGDIALTVAKLLVEGNKSVHFTGFDVCDLKIENPLVALPSKKSHLFRANATVTWSAKSISLSIYSVDTNGKKTLSHATLKIRLFSNSIPWLDEWKPMEYLINGRIASLQQGAINGNNHTLKRSMIYKLFTSIVDYSDNYQGLQEVILDSVELEAVAKVSFRVDSQGFVMNPCWIDSLGHLAGFVMNGNETLQSDRSVFINHGWASLRFAQAPQHGKLYTTYNKMHQISGKLYAGNTYVLDGKQIIAVFEKVAFQEVPRRILGNLLRDPSETVSLFSKETQSVSKDNAAVQIGQPEHFKLKDQQPPYTSPPSPANTPKPSCDFSRVLAIIAEEVGTSPSELHCESIFADLGLDSLLSLTVISRINEEMSMEIPSTLFAECQTVKELQNFIEPHESVRMDTPELTSWSEDENSISKNSLSTNSDSGDFRVVIRQAIAEETGTPAEDIALTTRLADIGVDSLLGLTIADTLSEALGSDVPKSLLADNGTIEEVEAALQKVLGLPTQNGADQMIQNGPKATSIVLQRASTQIPRRVLFLLPDGSGSAASYASLAKLDPSVTVYGINCPWRTTPEEIIRLGVTTLQMVEKMVAEVRRNQPHGPYYIGGWSAGGIFAFEAARMLAAEGEVVEKLLLIDAPNPIGLENPPSRMFEFFESVGLFGGSHTNKNVPKWLRQHFDSVVRMLDGYDPLPWPDAPPTAIIFARDGICKDPSGPRMETRPDDPREMLWLLHNRTDFSAHGWASLVGATKVMDILVLDNVNHFSMMDEGPHMGKTRKYIRRKVLEIE